MDSQAHGSSDEWVVVLGVVLKCSPECVQLVFLSHAKEYVKVINLIKVHRIDLVNSGVPKAINPLVAIK